jgi:hypothetical protein
MAEWISADHDSELLHPDATANKRIRVAFSKAVGLPQRVVMNDDDAVLAQVAASECVRSDDLESLLEATTLLGEVVRKAADAHDACRLVMVGHPRFVYQADLLDGEGHGWRVGVCLALELRDGRVVSPTGSKHQERGRAQHALARQIDAQVG